MGIEHILGEDGPVLTGSVVTKADQTTTVVEVEGPYSALEDIVPSKGDTSTECEFVPSGMAVESATLSGDGDGGGKISIRCIYVGTDGGSTAAPDRITYTISMGEVVTDLKAHPHFNSANESLRVQIAQWLATDPIERYDPTAQGIEYMYRDKNDVLQPVTGNAIDYCKAYMHGIETYMRYFPIVDKVSYWKRPPGLTIVGLSVTGGTARFSDKIGEWDTPSISLSGYTSGGWFKSGDNWQQPQKGGWTRREQWTYTPDGSSSDFGWIYN